MKKEGELQMEEPNIKKSQKKNRKIFFLVATALIFFVLALASVIIRCIKSYDDEEYQTKYGWVEIE